MTKDIRAGEIAVTLPETFDAGVKRGGRTSKAVTGDVLRATSVATVRGTEGSVSARLLTRAIEPLMKTTAAAAMPAGRI